MNNRPCCDDSCCPPTPTPPPAPILTPVPAALDSHAVRDHVREGYSQIARSGCCGPSGGGCCGATAFSPDQLAQAIGYASGELDPKVRSASAVNPASEPIIGI